MGDLFWNKVFGALLATALGIFGIMEVGHALIHAHEPHEPGYKIAIAETTTTIAEVVEEVSLAQLLNEASVSGGERVAKKCAACHTFTKSGADKIGPNLWNVLGNPSASSTSFGYSPAMLAFGKAWDYETLNAFLSNPKATVAGTAMSFAGLKKPKDAANLLVYLRSLSDTPIDLPELPVALPVELPAEPIAQTAADAALALGNAAEGVLPEKADPAGNDHE